MKKVSGNLIKRIAKYKNSAISLVKSQIELLKLLATGKTLKEIAEITNKKYNNVHKKTINLYKKFGVNNRAELIKRALNKDIIATRDVKTKFKKRFTKFRNDISVQPLELPRFTYKESLFLILRISGKTKKEILNITNCLNIYSLNCIQNNIFKKLHCDNIFQVIKVLLKSNMRYFK